MSRSKFGVGADGLLTRGTAISISHIPLGGELLQLPAFVPCPKETFRGFAYYPAGLWLSRT